MRNWRRSLWAVLLLPIALGSLSVAAENEPFRLKDGDRVVFLGNTFVERAQRYGEIERLMTTRFAEARITFRNLGWSGDTVFADSRGIFDPPAVGYQRMLEQLAELKPTVVFLAYGANEAFAGEQGLSAYVKQFRTLRGDIAKLGSRMVVLSPILQQRRPTPLPDPTTHNANLAVYSRAMQTVCLETGDLFVDLLAPWTPSNAETATSELYDPNGLHLSRTGYQAVAERIEQALWPSKLAWTLHLSADGTVVISQGVTATPDGNADIAAGRWSWELVDDRLEDWRRTTRPRQLRISNLPAGRYALSADGIVLATATAEEWDSGQITFASSADQKQSEALRQAIISKNQLYFYSWRPQNVTYFFGLRKHEQGQTAAEIAQFAPLIASAETRIGQLARPQSRRYALVSVKERP